VAKQMRPLPHVPASTILEATHLDPGYEQRLDLWNYSSDDDENRHLDYVTLSVVSKASGDPRLSVTTRLSRSPDHDLDSREGIGRLVPAARLSILTIPLTALMSLSPQAVSRVQRADLILQALGEDVSPWSTSTCQVDGAPAAFRVLRWTTGALWVGEHRDVTVSAIAHGDWPEPLKLRSMDVAAAELLTR
jgi:hypothetical protein